MDPYTLQKYAQIVHQERLERAMNQPRGELAPSPIWRMIAFAQRAIKTALSVRVSLTIRTQTDQQRRAITEPDMCLE